MLIWNIVGSVHPDVSLATVLFERDFMESMFMPLSRFDVFIPGAFPEHTYVNRTFTNRRTNLVRDPEREIADAFQQKGRIVLISGPSKCGKTIALEHVMKQANLITVHGSRIVSAESLWQTVINQLQLPIHKVTDKKNILLNGRELNTGAKLKLPAAELGGGVKSIHADSNETGHQVTYGDDLFTLAAQSLINKSLVLFIDDFHTMNNEIKTEIASQIKAAAEIGVKVCLAEVPHRADEPISANPDLTGRVEKIIFDYWSNNDLKSIGKLGFAKLKIDISDASLVTLAGEAGGSPQLMQLFCLEAAKILNIEYELPKQSTISLSINEVNLIFVNVVQQVERESILNVLDHGPDERGKPRKKYPAKVLGEADNYEITLAAIALNPSCGQFHWDQGNDSISSRINKICSSQKISPQREQISRALSQMVTLADKNMPKQPILDWDEKKGLHILDPYFLFYLRWSEKYMPVRESVRG